MKYENKMVEGISKETLMALERIAMKASCTLGERGGLEDRNNDSEDFQELSVWSIREMLEQAYLLGKADAAKQVR